MPTKRDALSLIATEAPTPEAGEIVRYGSSVDYRQHTKNQFGVDVAHGGAETAIFRRRMVVMANPNLATATASQFPAVPTLTATATASNDAEGPWINHATTTTSGNPSGIITTTFDVFRPGWLPDAIFRVKTAASIASIRILIGLFSANPDAVPGTLHGAWFRYDTGVDGSAFWRAVVAAGGTPTVVTTTKAIAADTAYKLRIEMVSETLGPPGSTPDIVRFHINDVVYAWHYRVSRQSVAASAIPLANQTLGLGIRVVTLTTATKNLKWDFAAVNAC